MKTRYLLLAMTIAALVSNGAFAVLSVPGTGNGYGQPCAGQRTYGTGPCYPTAYVPTFASAVNSTNAFNLGLQPDYFSTVPNYANSPSPTINPDGSVTGGLHKFMDELPQIGKPNGLGMELVVATPDTVSYIGQPVADQPTDGIEYNSDYYEIGVVQYSMKMHSELPATTLRGYVQIETPEVATALQNAGTPSAHYPLTYPNGNAIKNLAGQQVYAVAPPNYLGPSIVAQKNKPVRVKFTNYLPVGVDGDLPFPVDDTYMGAGEGANGQMHTQNRVTVHLHGGATPWISDGTPHQWTAPVGETTTLARGPSVRFVPDMWFDTQGNTIAACAGQLTCSAAGATNDPGQGSLTMYYTNQQSAKFMFYHDHAYGLTRLNVYGGMAAGYVLKDAVEDDLINGTNLSGGNPGNAKLPDGIGIPLIMQDKTWVDANAIKNQDPTWAWGSKPAKAGTPATPVTGDLWLPHVYMPNQHPTSPGGVNDVGRWDYNTWIYPPITTQIIGPVTNLSYNPDGSTPNEPPLVPGTPNPTGTPESFMDSITINGTAWPKLTVTPGMHRFKMLNAADDRTFSLNWYIADPIGLTVVSGGVGYTNPQVTLSGGWKNGTGTPAQVNAIVSGVVDSITLTSTTNPGYLNPPVVTLVGGGGSGATAIATLDPNSPVGFVVTVTNGGRGYTSAPTVKFTGVHKYPIPTADATVNNMIVDMQVVSPAVPAYDVPPTVTITDTTGSGALVMAAPNAEIKMVPAMLNPAYPSTWPADGRNGGTPDPAVAGPQFTILANEGGWMPKPQTLPVQPVTYEQSRRVIFTLSVKEHGLVVGPAERFDTLVDFTGYEGKTIILYNDGPAPYPFFDERYDYYAGSPDNTFQGGAPTVLPGYGPNTRTMLQVNVCDPAITDPNSIYNCNGQTVQPFDMDALNKSWSAVYAKAQETPLVPTSSYNDVLKANIPDQAPNLADPAFTFKPWDPNTNTLSNNPVTIQIQDKAIIENWDMEYGRMNALLGGALPNLGPQAGVGQPYSYFNPPTEIMAPTFQPYPMVGTLGDGTQIWRLDHQGIDQHYMHFHLVNVQMIGRIAIDGTVFPIDPEEQGLKETIRLSPALDTFIAVRPVQPYLPWTLPNSVRPLDPAAPLNVLMTDSAGATLNNVMTDYGMEYVWHCHLLGHEEHDMMRPMVMVMPLNLTAPILNAGAKGIAYPAVNYVASGGLTITNGLSPYRYAISAGALPAGMTLTQTGTLSGTPSVIGTFNFTVSATDGSKPAKTVTVPQTLTIDASTLVPSVMTTTVPNGNVGNTYNQTIQVAGGTGPYTWASTGTLPDGLVFANGVLSGTPTTVGNYSFSVTATDSKNVKSSAQAFAMSISTTTLSTTVLPNSNIGVAYSQPLNVSGGVSPYTWGTTGTVPPGLAVTNGLISGNPTTAGTYSFTVTATDSANPLPTSSSKTYNVTIGASLTPSITTASLPAGTVGTAYNQTVSVIGGTAPYTFGTTGTLPTGLTFVNGVLSGNPTVPGTYNFSVTATDSKSVSSAPQAYSVTVGGTLLNAVTDLTAVVSSSTGTKVTGETLTWTNTSTGQTGYTVEYAPSTTNVWTTLPGTVSGTSTMSISSTVVLAKNVTYSFRVTPVNGSTTGAVSNVAVIDMNAKPAIPTVLTAVSGTVGNPITIGLTWTDNSNNNTHFTVQKCKSNTPARVANCTAGKGWTNAATSGVVAGPNASSATVSGLTNNMSYMLRVVAKNAMGNNGASAPTAPTLAQ